MRERRLIKIVSGIILILICSLYATKFPSLTKPGIANLDTSNNQYTFSNNIIEVTFKLSDNDLTVTNFKDKLNNSTNFIKIRELFKILISSNTWITDTKMIAGSPKTEQVKAISNSMRVRERFNGWKVSIPFTYESGGKKLSLIWSAILRDGSNYINQETVCKADKGEWNITRVYMIDIKANNIIKGGTARDGGHPSFAGQFFFGQEMPVSKTTISSDKTSVEVYGPKQEKTREGETFKQTAAIGIYPDNQKRRGFQYYVERERIREHYAFLHYNNWWDIGGRNLNETKIKERIEIFGEELVEKRGVKLLGFMVDDGYDDLNTSRAQFIWDLNPGKFPSGIGTLKTASEKYGASMGFWLSPAGGYGGLSQRIAIARKSNPNVEIASNGTFKVYGPNYYEVFKKAVFKKIDAGVVAFKFDRVGANAENANALARLSVEMRERNPNVFINATIDTWGSPYFLWFFDSFWRQGADSKTEAYAVRDVQVTYRDYEASMTIRNNSMTPLNSLMLHGIGQGLLYQGKNYSHDQNGRKLDMNIPANLEDFNEEVKNYFSQGINLQELYITPSLMTKECWDILANVTKWAHKNHDVLLDAHFFGGVLVANDCYAQGRGKVYGVASWSEEKAILMIRNPSIGDGSITLKLEDAFEIPEYYAYSGYKLIDPFDLSATPITVEKDKEVKFSLKKRSVLLYEAEPQGTAIFNPNIESNLNKFKVKVFINKNSTNKNISISFNKKIKSIESTLFSAKGRIINTNKLSNTQQMSINIKNISKGIYFLRLSNKSYKVIRKICIL